MLIKIKWIITKIIAIPVCLIIGDVKFKSYSYITWDDAWEVIRIISELLIIINGFALPSVLIFPWYLRIPVWLPTIILVFFFMDYEHRRYLRKHH